jgi:hypothetical protein
MKKVFTAGNETITIVAAEGKKGWNVKVSHKRGKGKGADKASTGCRETFSTKALAEAAVTKLAAETVKRGWSEKQVYTRSAFSAIPEAPKSPKAAAQSK